jgi:rod shape-determining protein MreD
MYLLLPFLLALFAACFETAFFPHLRLTLFAPFLALVYQKKELIPSLWLALVAGLIIDLLNSEFRLGISALNYLLTTALLHRQKRHFFVDKPLSLSLFTILISLVSALFYFIFLPFLDTKSVMNGSWALSSFVQTPLLDAFYALLWFTCPMMFYRYVRKIGWKQLFLKRDSR